jgi:hypothetical protein
MGRGEFCGEKVDGGSLAVFVFPSVYNYKHKSTHKVNNQAGSASQSGVGVHQMRPIGIKPTF